MVGGGLYCEREQEIRFFKFVCALEAFGVCFCVLKRLNESINLWPIMRIFLLLSIISSNLIYANECTSRASKVLSGEGRRSQTAIIATKTGGIRITLHQEPLRQALMREYKLKDVRQVRLTPSRSYEDISLLSIDGDGHQDEIVLKSVPYVLNRRAFLRPFRWDDMNKVDMIVPFDFKTGLFGRTFYCHLHLAHGSGGITLLGCYPRRMDITGKHHFFEPLFYPRPNSFKYLTTEESSTIVSVDKILGQ